MITFKTFLKQLDRQYHNSPEAMGLFPGRRRWILDFAHDVARDDSFPRKRKLTRIEVRNHLRSQGACPEAVLAMFLAWGEYRRHLGGDSRLSPTGQPDRTTDNGQ